ncbi:hypothetical protein GCM10027174_04640 [Salinifilum aidingensis]
MRVRAGALVPARGAQRVAGAGAVPAEAVDGGQSQQRGQARSEHDSEVQRRFQQRGQQGRRQHAAPPRSCWVRGDSGSA